ncbi:MAG: DUF2271 domain-containing protein [Alphaproteobacteria bacterium]|jgi:hypothetical protein|nr:DUF2271 domain-containing protein [Alphaproteobacteria bacterium]MBU2040750.1 DUF2271 domain-containing protein [Alphaproteobacteria bacterium]MBU2125177.1 DUF2271 domain-containing protein [Alphaproteobacteria bacterium]MBU2289628.1 DUF2271 domain-containing protein [Alphaproteobacteria bacterium]MBU2396548.1 DUF2271 domain-containing protein [Alphaproteobacteria bacterium]
MRTPSLALSAAALSAIAAPALAADLAVSVEIPRLSVAAYHRPYVAVWIERPDQTAVRTLAVWYEVSNVAEGKDWLKDMRTWWRRGGRAMTMPADGISSATKAPGRHAVTVPGARLSNLPAGDYVMVVEAARELGGREAVRVPFRWGAANAGSASGSTELGAVRVTVTR